MNTSSFFQSSTEYDAIRVDHQKQAEQILELQSLVSNMRSRPAQLLTSPATSFSTPGTCIPLIFAIFPFYFAIICYFEYR
jgi:hypothetical protein